MTTETTHHVTTVPHKDGGCTGLRQTLFTVTQFASGHPAFSSGSLRNLVFKATSRQSTKGVIPGNGLLESGAIVRLGRRVLIDEAKFLAWVAAAGGTQ